MMMNIAENELEGTVDEVYKGFSIATTAQPFLIINQVQVNQGFARPQLTS